MKLRVAVVEDEPFMRLAICTALNLAGLEVVLDGATGAEIVEKSKNIPIDVAILDLHLGEGPTGLDVANVLRRSNSKLGVVFLTSFEDPRLLSSSLPPAPEGSQYLTKGSLNDVQTLITAVSKSLKKVEGRSTGTLGHLTDNQVEVLKLVASGLSNSEIAKKRYVTEKSVEVAISRIAKSLGLASNSTQNQRVHIAQVYFRAIGKPLL